MQKPRNLVNAFHSWVTCVLYCCCYLEMLIVPFRILFGLICSSGQYLSGRWILSEMRLIPRGDGVYAGEYVCFCVTVIIDQGRSAFNTDWYLTLEIVRRPKLDWFIINTAIWDNVISMCRSSYVYNLSFVFRNLQICGRGTSKGKQGVNLPIRFLRTPYILRKTVLLYESLKADWAVLSSLCAFRGCYSRWSI